MTFVKKCAMLYKREERCFRGFLRCLPHSNELNKYIREDFIMTFDLKKLFWPLSFVAVGLFHFIFMFFNYAAVFISTAGYSQSAGFSAYKCMAMGEESISYGMSLVKENGFRSFLLILVSLALIVTVILSVCFLVIGVLGLLRELANVNVLDGEKQGLVNKLTKPAFTLFFGLNAASALFLLVSCLFNVKETSFGVTARAGVRPGIGMFFLLLLSAFAVFGLPVLEKMLGASFSVQGATYRCSACGAKAKASDKFCSACGGAVVKHEPEQYQCSSCGKKAKATDKFCSACGAAIVAVEKEAAEAEPTENEGDAV